MFTVHITANCYRKIIVPIPKNVFKKLILIAKPEVPPTDLVSCSIFIS